MQWRHVEKLQTFRRFLVPSSSVPSSPFDRLLDPEGEGSMILQNMVSSKIQIRIREEFICNPLKTKLICFI
jgi:hypothetical protein